MITSSAARGTATGSLHLPKHQFSSPSPTGSLRHQARTLRVRSSVRTGKSSNVPRPAFDRAASLCTRPTAPSPSAFQDRRQRLLQLPSPTSVSSSRTYVIYILASGPSRSPPQAPLRRPGCVISPPAPASADPVVLPVRSFASLLFFKFDMFPRTFAASQRRVVLVPAASALVARHRRRQARLLRRSSSARPPCWPCHGATLVQLKGACFPDRNNKSTQLSWSIPFAMHSNNTVQFLDPVLSHASSQPLPGLASAAQASFYIAFASSRIGRSGDMRYDEFSGCSSTILPGKKTGAMKNDVSKVTLPAWPGQG